MKYPYIKKAKLTRAQIAKAFGYSSVHSFNTSSANKRHMAGLDECLRMNEENNADNIIGLFEAAKGEFLLDKTKKCNTYDVIKAAIDQIK
jgi:hypothetical protein